MDTGEQQRFCLICSVPINEVHLGIDSCRACAVFYKRICSNNRPPTKCKGGDGLCIENDPSTSCRKCRYTRYSEVLKKAFATDKVEDKIPGNLPIVCDPVQLQKAKELQERTQFIDHNTFFLEQPSCSDTPLLDKIRWSYSLMCQTRKTGETATKPISYQIFQGDFDGSELKFLPCTYSMIVPNARILAATLYDFAKMTFPDFSALDPMTRGACIGNNFQQISLIDGMYRSNHFFPDDLDTYFSSYTTIMNTETIQSFLHDCPFETNTKEAIEALKKGMKRQKSMNRVHFHRVKPDDVEFIALLGLTFWNEEVAIVSDELAIAVEKYREVILKEMHMVYKNRGKTDYATRLGELFCLLDSLMENVTLGQHDIEVYRLFNLFNEAFPSLSDDNK